MFAQYRSLRHSLVASAIAVMALHAPAKAETGAQMQPAVTINYTQKGISARRVVEMLVKEVNKVNPGAKYDVVGYETMPKNAYWPVSARVNEVRGLLLANGVNKGQTYVLVKPTDTPYQKIDIFVRN